MIYSITRELHEQQVHAAFERGFEKGKAEALHTPEGEDYDELVRKAAKYDALLRVYQQQLIKAVWYQDEIDRYEKSR